MTCRACSKTKDNRSPDDVVRELQASVEALRAEPCKKPRGHDGWVRCNCPPPALGEPQEGGRE